jgi:hypothetical protein
MARIGRIINLGGKPYEAHISAVPMPTEFVKSYASRLGPGWRIPTNEEIMAMHGVRAGKTKRDLRPAPRRASSSELGAIVRLFLDVVDVGEYVTDHRGLPQVEIVSYSQGEARWGFFPLNAIRFSTCRETSSQFFALCVREVSNGEGRDHPPPAGVYVRLARAAGNAVSVVVRVAKGLKKAGVPKADMEAYLRQTKNAPYGDVIRRSVAIMNRYGISYDEPEDL